MNYLVTGTGTDWHFRTAIQRGASGPVGVRIVGPRYVGDGLLLDVRHGLRRRGQVCGEVPGARRRQRVERDRQHDVLHVQRRRSGDVSRGDRDRTQSRNFFQLTPEQVRTGQIVFLFIGAYVALGFPFSVFGGIVNGFQRQYLNGAVAFVWRL